MCMCMCYGQLGSFSGLLKVKERIRKGKERKGKDQERIRKIWKKDYLSYLI